MPRPARGWSRRALVLSSDDPALWNLTHPEDVVALHRRDVAAGAEAIVTNTFGANRCWLAKFGRTDLGRVDQSSRGRVWLGRPPAEPPS